MLSEELSALNLDTLYISVLSDHKNYLPLFQIRYLGEPCDQKSYLPLF